MGSHSYRPIKKNIAVAKRHSKGDYALERINYEHTSVEDMVESGKKFDVVCSLEVRLSTLIALVVH